MAVALDAFTLIGHSSAATQSASHTATGANLCALIAISRPNGLVVTSCTYDGVGATKVLQEQASGKVGTEIWQIAGIPAGSSTVATAFNTTTGTRTTAVWTFSSVSQSDPVYSSASDYDTYGSSSSSVPSDSTESCAGAAITAFWGTITGSYDWNSAGSPSSAGYDQLGGDPTTTFSFTYFDVDRWSVCVVMLAPASNAHRGTMIFSKIQNFYDELKRGLIPAWDLKRRYGGLHA